jgi:hypothetical protein
MAEQPPPILNPCQICGQEEVAFTIIPAGEGDPQFLGVGCFTRVGLELAKAILPAEEVASTLGPLFVNPAREDLHEGAKSRRKAKPEPPAPEPQPSPGPAPGSPEVPTAAENG